MIDFVLLWYKTQKREPEKPPSFDSFQTLSGPYYYFAYNDQKSTKKVVVKETPEACYIFIPKIYQRKRLESITDYDSIFNRNLDLFFHRSNYYLAIKFDRTTQNFTLFNDPFGQLNIYYYEADDFLVFTTRINHILSFYKNHEFDEEGLFDFVNFGCTVLNKTLFKNIYQLSNATELFLDNHKLRKQIYWRSTLQVDPKPITKKRIHESFETMTAAFRKVFTHFPEVGIALSSGLDSRLILGVLSRLNCKIKTYNAAGYGEEKSARELAAVAGADFKTFPFDKEDFAEIIPRYSQITGGHLHLNQFWGMRLAELVAKEDRPPPVLLNGYMLDGLFNFWHTPLNPTAKRVKLPEFLDYMADFFPLPPFALLKKIFSRAVIEKLMNNREKNLALFYEEKKDLGLFLLEENFYLENRGKNYTSAMFKYSENFLDSFFPGIEPEIFHIGISLPLEVRWSGQFYKELFIQELNEFALVKYPRIDTNLVKANKLLYRLRHRLKKNLRYYSRKISRGNIHLFKGKATSFSRFKHDEKYYQYFLQQLTESQLRKEGYLLKNAPENIITLLNKGEKSIMTFVQSLLTVDLFLKNYFT